ncbi:MAG: isoprenylcysteine carboxylmethyltransferase family protein [Alphaproteobacteria bacterium]
MIFRRKRRRLDTEFSSAHPLDDDDIGELKLPKFVAQPPAVFLVAVLGGAAVEQFVLPLSFGLRWWGVGLGFLVFVAGVSLSMMAMQAFRKAASSPDPNHMPSKLVETGPFKRTRNPLYLGTLLMLIGLGLGANLPWVVIAAVPAMLIIHFGVVIREEAYLEDLFGEKYRAYRDRVRRWV